MSKSDRTVFVETETLDSLRTELTRGVSRIQIKPTGSSFSPDELRSFLSRVGADEYEVTRPESAAEAGEPSGGILIVRSPANDEFARPGISNESLADHHGPTTEFELRMVNLGLLDVGPGMTVWDVGAGTGSVSIESARLNPSARYWAIEADPDRFKTLTDNTQTFGTYNVRAKQGEAPAIFSDCPDPDRVFIGGTGGNVESILEGINRRLAEEGLILGNFLRMKHLKTAQALLGGWGYDVELSQVAFYDGNCAGSDSISWQEGPALPVVRARKKPTSPLSD